jgi:serine/threonine protein kinase
LREARAASALNHPNIVTSYEVGSEDGVDFIAMEIVAGKTLADKLRSGPVSSADAVSWGLQITARWCARTPRGWRIAT